MFFTLKSSILVISGYLRTVQVAPGHPVMPCESLGKSLQTCLSQDKSGFPDVTHSLDLSFHFAELLHLMSLVVPRSQSHPNEAPKKSHSLGAHLLKSSRLALEAEESPCV
jgi:hypothetical protein